MFTFESGGLRALRTLRAFVHTWRLKTSLLIEFCAHGRSKGPFEPALAPPGRSKGPFELAAALPGRSKGPFEPAPEPPERSKKLFR